MVKLSVQNYDNIFQFIKYIKIMSNYDCSYLNIVKKVEEGILININWVYLDLIITRAMFQNVFDDYFFFGLNSILASLYLSRGCVSKKGLNRVKWAQVLLGF